MGYVSARVSNALVERLRRNATGLVYAGGRLPEGKAWVEVVDRVPGVKPEPGAPRWHVVSSAGWSNIASRWPVALVLNAPDLHFRRSPEGDLCLVEITP